MKKANKTVVATADNFPRSLRSGHPFSAVPHLLRSVRNRRMNPYDTPLANSEENLGSVNFVSGRPCRACGSANTNGDSALRSRPSILFVVFLGWVFLLIRGAFTMRISQCRDCGEVSRYKSTGSWFAMGLLIALILLVMLSIVGGGN
jgi:hypothetical protein